MPRVNLNKQLMMPKYFTDWIRIKKALLHVSNMEIGNELGITKQAVSYKLKTNTYSLEDVIILFQFFKATDEEVAKLMQVERRK